MTPLVAQIEDHLACVLTFNLLFFCGVGSDAHPRSRASFFFGDSGFLGPLGGVV